MGAVTVAVLDATTVAEIDEGTGSDAALELDVRRTDPGVDHVCGHTDSGRIVGVRAVEWWVELVDAIEAPRRRVLDGADLDDMVDVNVGNRRVTLEPGQIRRGQLGGETSGGVVPFLHDIDTQALLSCNEGVERAVDLDDVPLCPVRGGVGRTDGLVGRWRRSGGEDCRRQRFVDGDRADDEGRQQERQRGSTTDSGLSH